MDRFAAKGGWWVVGQLALFVVLGAALVAGPTANFAGSEVVRWLGGVVVLVGVSVALAALMRLGSRVTPYPAPVPGGHIIDDGLYGLVRHPIYGGVVAMAIGAAALDLNGVAALVAVVFPVFFWAKSEHEEALMLEEHPGYASYRARVRRRMIPWLL